MNTQAKIAFLTSQNKALSQEVQYFERRAIFAENQVLELSSIVSALEAKVLVLLELLQQQGVSKDSHNSSKPPSSDIKPVKKSLRSVSSRKSGGQQGHKGISLELRATPDKIIDLKSDFCSVCGSSLAGQAQELQAKRQVVELPPIAPIYEEYRQYSCHCATCSHQQKADFPSHVTAPIQYGSSVIALTSYFSVYQYIPFKRLTNLFDQVFSLPLSQGSVHTMLAKSAERCEVVCKVIEQEIAQSKVVGSDETGAKVNGTKWWIWVWQTVLNTLIVATDNRAYKSIETVWQNGLRKAVLISDRWAAQLKMQVKGHQLCLAHLLRDLVFLVETEKHSFATQFHSLIQKVFVLKKELLQKQKAWVATEKDALVLEQELNELLSQSIDKSTYPQTQTFQASMLKYRNYLFPCLYDLDIPPDNNASERAIRNIKVKQKVSGQFKTGQMFFCQIRSVIDTMLKRGIPLLHTLKEVCSLEMHKPTKIEVPE